MELLIYKKNINGIAFQSGPGNKNTNCFYSEVCEDGRGALSTEMFTSKKCRLAIIAEL